MGFRFWKVHGTENDFPLLDTATSGDIPTWTGTDVAPWFVREICDRRAGVGGDGLLIVERDRAGGRMIMYNPDGSRAEMCGNGLRCVAKHVAEMRGDRPAFVIIETDAGPKSCRLIWEGGVVTAVEVDMGAPVLDRASIPVAGSGSNRDIAIDVGARSFRATCVSMGNPHAVIVVDEPPMPLAETFGSRVETHPLFPKRINVEFVRPVGANRFETAVWERGAGITRACGTGASATGVALCLEGRAKLGETLVVALPGGDLSITVLPDLTNVRMRGAAVVVYEGEANPSMIQRFHETEGGPHRP
ncbi:MAG: diaminopimelate epimerase [Deltaproteobacteria bacterium]|nr:diaminopimelate epimerase [Deltaproteobacteria bacterium]